MRTVLVTGAGGFIGSHAVEALVRTGRQVKALIRYNSTATIGWLRDLDSDLLNQVQVVKGDIRSSDSVRSAMKDCDEVLHLAALIGIPYSYDSPSSYVETNVTGSLNILQAARDLAVERIVLTSTSEVYGSAQFVPITEDHPLQAQSPYSASKIAADQLALSFWRSFDTPVVVLRPFNTYGPRQSLRAVVPTIISQLLLGKTQIELGAITTSRDLTYVSDTAQAFISALESDGAVGRVVHLGTGYELSVGELVKLISELMGASAVAVTDPERVRPPRSEVDRLVADASLARQILGWAPARTGREGLQEGLSRTIDWLRSRQEFEADSWTQYHV